MSLHHFSISLVALDQVAAELMVPLITEYTRTWTLDPHVCHTPCGESTTDLGAYSLCATLGFSKSGLESEFLYLHSEGEGMPSWMDLISERVPIRQLRGWIGNQGRSVKEICFCECLGQKHTERQRG